MNNAATACECEGGRSVMDPQFPSVQSSVLASLSSLFWLTPSLQPQCFGSLSELSSASFPEAEGKLFPAKKA